ncbi:MAG: thermonuclease family protein [Patescibacteria group bacterium]
MNTKKKVLLVCVVVCIGVIGYWILLPERVEQQKVVSIDPRVLYPVEAILDGDTFTLVVKRKHITVRMLGIDTPETVDPRKPAQCYGAEASAETKSMLKDHSVRLVLNPDREVLDKYGRYLAYVYRDDGMFINEHLLEKGFAREYTYGKPYSLQKEFRKTEREAKQNKKGLWGECE